MPEMEEGEPRQSRCDRYRDTMEGLWRERPQIKGGSRWIKTTCDCLRWPHRTHAKKPWRHLHPPWAPHACLQKFSPPSNFQLSVRGKKKISCMSCLLKPTTISSRKRGKQIVFFWEVIFSLGSLTEQYFGKRCHDKKLPEETYAVREVMGRRQWGNRMPGMHWRAWCCVLYDPLNISCYGFVFEKCSILLFFI